MAIFDIQIRAQSFLAAQLVALQSKKICPPAPWPVGGDSVRVQRIEFVANAIRHDVPGRTRIAQEVVVHVASNADVLANPDQPPTLELPFRYRVLIDLDYVLTAHGCQLQMQYADTEPIGAPPLPPWVSSATVDAAARAAFARAVGSTIWPLDFANLLPETAGEPVTRVGLTASGDLALFVIRAETGTTGDPAAWERFFAGAVSDGLGGADWGLLVESATIEAMIAERVRQTAAGLEGISLVDSWYSAAPGVARVGVKIAFDGEWLHVLGTPLLDVHVEEIVQADLSVPQPGQLTTDIYLPDVAGTADILLDVVRSATGALLTALTGFAQATVDAAVADIRLPAIADCQAITPLHHRCTREFMPPNVAGLHMRLTGLQALPDRVALTGEMRTVPLTPSVLTSSVGETSWEPPETTCGAGGGDVAAVAVFGSHPTEMTLLHAEVVMNHTGTTPVYLCDVEVCDPLGRIRPDAARWDGDMPLPAKIVLEVPNPGSEYSRPGYHVDLLVTTTLGARLVRLKTAEELTDDVIARSTAAVLVASGDCKKLVARPISELIWLVDPPYDHEPLHRWSFVIEGLVAGDTVQLVGSAGKALVHAYALPGLVTQLSALVVPGGEGPELTFVREHAGDVGPQMPELGVEIRQQLASVAATIPLEAPCRRVFASQLWARNGVVAVLDDTLVAFDLATPTRPRRIGRWPVEGLRDAWPWRDGLLVCHERGFAVIGADRRMTAAGPERESSQLLDAVPGREAVHVLSTTAIETRSLNLDVRSDVDADGARCLLRSGQRLLAGGGGAGVAAYRLTPDGMVTSVARSLADIHVAALEPAPDDADGGSVLATLTNGSAWLLAFDGDGYGREVAIYPEPPWFAGATRAGRLLVRVTPDRRSLEVSALGESRLVGAEASRPVG